MRIVAVTACATGVAHTYMAQVALEKECRQRGYSIQVETQGSMGIENELEQEDIASADVVILAVAISIEGEERFEEKSEQGKVLQVDPAEAIKHPAELLNRAEQLRKG